jgi:hypothetical protein
MSGPADRLRLQDLTEAIKRSTRGAAMTLQIQREERLMYVTFLFE